MNLYELLKIAARVANDAHKGQVDKGNHPYMEHVEAVVAGVKTTEEKITAYLHDVIEDSDITIEDLEMMGFPPEIISAIKSITKSDEEYELYLQRVKANDIARAVKLADLKHNMDITRIENPTEKDFKRLEKYKKSLKYLVDA